MEIKHRLYYVPKLCVKRTGVQGYVHFWTLVETSFERPLVLKCKCYCFNFCTPLLTFLVKVHLFL